jgi:perosamine synthetase
VAAFVGWPSPMDRIADFCYANNLDLVEDCAHVLGSRFGGRHVGNFGRASVFSFAHSKMINTGGGGMVRIGSKEQNGESDKRFY